MSMALEMCAKNGVAPSPHGAAPVPLHSSNPLGEAIRPVAAPLRMPRSRPAGLPQRLAPASLTTTNRCVKRRIPTKQALCQIPCPGMAGLPRSAKQCSSGALRERRFLPRACLPPNPCLAGYSAHPVGSGLWVILTDARLAGAAIGWSGNCRSWGAQWEPRFFHLPSGPSFELKIAHMYTTHHWMR